MSMHKVSELEGALLDAAVAKAEGWASLPVCWQTCGPIIEREQIATYYAYEWSAYVWIAGYRIDADVEWEMPFIAVEHKQCGPTPLIAAMRAYVASKFGEEVDL